MLARRTGGILPPMSFEEALEVTQIYSVLGLVPDNEGLLTQRPFRSPHHTISDAGLVGGGPLGRPGELSMAHRGVLFLDEFPEFHKNVLEVLRQPLEYGVIHLARANLNLVYPCRVMLVAAMNPCLCGYYNVPGRKCQCKPARVLDYHHRISGPIMDRIDINVEAGLVAHEHLLNLGPADRDSAWYRERVEAARERQLHRFRDIPGVVCNSDMGPRELRQFCMVSARGRKCLNDAVKQHGFSARTHDRILKLARTRADLEGRPDISETDLLFAISLRVLDRKGWLHVDANRDKGLAKYGFPKPPSDAH